MLGSVQDAMLDIISGCLFLTSFSCKGSYSMSRGGAVDIAPVGSPGQLRPDSPIFQEIQWFSQIPQNPKGSPRFL